MRPEKGIYQSSEPRHRHYSEQIGHWKRGEAYRFSQIFGFKPATLGAQLVPVRSEIDNEPIYIRHGSHGR